MQGRVSQLVLFIDIPSLLDVFSHLAMTNERDSKSHIILNTYGYLRPSSIPDGRGRQTIILRLEDV